MNLRPLLIGIIFAGITGAGMISSADEPAKDGKAIFLASKCDMCHSVTSACLDSKKKTGAFDLSKIGDSVNAETMTKYLKKEIELKGKKHTIAWKGTDQDLEILTKWMETLKTEKTEKVIIEEPK